jgi:NosR/NirI family nitrous oxide reductase transcriptional regulator
VTRHPWIRGLFAAVALCLALAPGMAGARTEAPTHLDCAEMPCAEILPGAVRFEEAVPGQPFLVGLDDAGERVGWVVLSTDAVQIKAYSGKPLVTLIGLRVDGTISGARVIYHSEPILLLGIPEKALTDFMDFYTGRAVADNVVVGSSPDPKAVTVDIISGATVTALAANQTVLETGRRMAQAVGVLERPQAVKGEFVVSETDLTWQQMEDAGVLGRLTVTGAEMGRPSEGHPFVDVWYTIADAPQVGRPLIGPGDYKWLMEKLQPGEHLLWVAGNGSTSFKGSGFVRGGIFDRVRVEQGLNSILFRDTDYFNVSGVPAVGAPAMNEGAVFIAREGRLDAGAPFNFVFLGSVYDGQGGFSRDFHAFSSTFSLPESVFKRAEVPRKAGIWEQAWYNQRYRVVALAIFLLFVMGLFVARRWLTGSMKRLQRIHLAVMLTSFFGLGIALHAQPSITQMMTLVGSATKDTWSWGLFLAEPLLFVSWISIAIVTLIWGRGVFCGWTCPYGAMNELTFKLGRALGLKHYELPPKIHRVARFARYVVLVVLLGVYLWSPEMGERAAEIEPFKSTFFVRPWTREWYFLGWWVVLAALPLVWYRPFCRYLCPLGAGLAIPGSLRRSGPKRRNFCQSCTICTRGCEPMAIRDNGTIDPRECLSCMECEANYMDKKVCPPLVGLDKLRISAEREGVAPPEKKLAKLMHDLEDW